jgi:hypothetical protein
MPIRFNQLASAPARALQIYLVLIGCAANQQVITYGRLADRAGVLTPTWLFATERGRSLAASPLRSQNLELG